MTSTTQRHSNGIDHVTPLTVGKTFPTVSTVRTAGGLLAVGSLAWAVTLFAVGAASTTPVGAMIGDLGGLAFQLSLLGLLHVQSRTLATGPKRFWKVAFIVERVLLGIAITWSVLHAFAPTLPFLPILDLFWPLSMIGMFVIGVAILVKGHWQGALRIWPMIAESWAVICVPALAIAGQYVGAWLPGAHLLVGYVTLGILLAVKPQLTGATK